VGSIAPPLSKLSPEFKVGGSHFAYTTDRDKRTCLAIGDLTTGKASIRYCSPQGWIPGFLRASEDVVTFVENGDNPAFTKAGARGSLTPRD
jgi:hypothetical protein